MAKIYAGRRGPNGCEVTVDGMALARSADVRRSASGEFEWGYNGSGPGALALAILADHFGDAGLAFASYRRFGESVIANLRDDEWMLTGEQIDMALANSVDVPMTLDQLLDKVRGLPR